jgi:hypothetical protein
VPDRARLPEIGLRPGERVRFRRGTRWHEGRLVGVEADGSLQVTDRKGAARSLPIACIEVRREGRRGGAVWRSVPAVINQPEQLDLW